MTAAASAIALVLFDIDGTLVAPGGAGRRAMLEAGTALFGDAFRVDELDPSGKLDPVIFEELAERHPELDLRGRAGEFHQYYLAAMRRQADRLRPLPGARSTLERLATEPRVALGILTGNVAAVATLKLEATGMTQPGRTDPFAVRVHGDDAPRRADLVPLAQRRYRLRHGATAVPRPVLVGDTPRDVEAAHAHGAPVLAVATGRWSADALRAAGADRVVQDLLDPSPLLELIATTLSPTPETRPGAARTRRETRS